MIKKLAVFFLSLQTFLAVSDSLASPWGLPQELTDQNMKIVFKVHAPWNILNGAAEQVSGNLSLTKLEELNSLQANVSVENIRYKAGLSIAGRLVAGWLRLNPPTPAKFIIGKSTLSCTPEAISDQNSCKGTVDGQLTIWAKSHQIDIPIEMKPGKNGFVLQGVKEIKWGDYGFGDPNSTIASLKPVIDLNFSVELSSADKVEVSQIE